MSIGGGIYDRTRVKFEKNYILFCHRGFTLIEVLIAVAILAGMSLMMSNSMESVFTSKDTATIRADINHGVGLATDKLIRDLSMAFNTDSTFLGTSSQGSALVTGFVGDETKMNFSTMSGQHYIKNHADTDQVQVGYALEKKDDGSYSLYRRQTDYLTSTLSSGGKNYELLRNVTEFKLGYYSASKGEWVSSWDTESVSTSGKLPSQVKVKITVASKNPSEDDAGEPETTFFELIVPIRMYEKVTF